MLTLYSSLSQKGTKGNKLLWIFEDADADNDDDDDCDDDDDDDDDNDNFDFVILTYTLKGIYLCPFMLIIRTFPWNRYIRSTS